MIKGDASENPISSEEPLDPATEFKFPKGLQIAFTVLFGTVILLIITLYIYIIVMKPEGINPKDFGTSELLITSLVILTVINIPWHKLGFRVKKIGMIELEEVVKGQAKNNSKELADLQKKIDELEKKISQGKTVESEDNKLQQLIFDFLSRYNRWAFSASRIQSWGSSQPGFEELGKHSVEDIRAGLRRLLSNGKVTTRVSTKGNTIYTVK